MFEKKPDAYNVLNDLLRQNPTWEALAQAVTTVTRRLVHEPRWKLQRARFHTTLGRGDFFDTQLGQGKVSLIRKQFVDANGNKLTEFVDDVEIDLGNGISTRVPMRTMPERQVMANNNVAMGFDFFSDHLDDADHQRVMRYIMRYWPESGDGNFIDFLGFVKNIRLYIYQLHTPDYGDPDKDVTKDPYLYLERLTREDLTYNRPGFGWDKETPANGFGGVYPTSHVELEFDAVKFTAPDYDGMTMLFYFLAPIHLVLHRYVQAVFAPQFNVYQATIGHSSMMHHGRYEWSPDAEIFSKLAIVGHVSNQLSGKLWLDDNFASVFPLPEGPMP